MRGLRLQKILSCVMVLFIAASMLLFSGMEVRAAVNIPETIRIGLYFNYSSARINTAVTSFTISADKGLLFGFMKDGSYTILLEDKSADATTVKKDGSYTIKLKESLKDLAAVQEEIQKLKEKGILAYPAYADGWQVWTGSFSDKDSAQKHLDGTVAQKLGKGTYSVVEPDSSRVALLSGTGAVMLFYQSASNYLRIAPRSDNDPSVLKVNNTPYRGVIDVRRLSGSDMTVINELPLEQYLYGVVPAEIGSSADPEALKAQAVAARTYAIGTMNKYKSLGFNLCTTTNTQVYRGYIKETAKTNKAIDDTKGIVLTYNGSLVSTFFFSSSGGRTEDAKNVWGYEYAYLKSVEDKYEDDKLTSNYYWERSFTAQQLKDIMVSQNNDIGDILSLTVTKVSEAGRAIEMVIKGTTGERVFKNEKCRLAFNSSLPSQWFTITTDAAVSETGSGTSSESRNLSSRGEADATSASVVASSSGETVSVVSSKTSSVQKIQLSGATVLGKKGAKNKLLPKTVTIINEDEVKVDVPMIPTVYKLSGRGYGHAVGMSQNGAMGMARAGFTFDQILTHYFTGTEVIGSSASAASAQGK